MADSMTETDDDQFRFTPRRKKEPQQVLDPNNPLLEKFQAALKEHLLRQINRLKDDIFEYETEAKKNNAKKEELGVQVYEEQQIISKQQATLENFMSQLETVSGARQEQENLLKEAKEAHRLERNKLLEVQAAEIELRNEVESANFLVHQMSQWESTLESDVTTKQRMLEKSRKDKVKLVEEKRFQDTLIYNLMTKIWQLENDLEKMDVQLKVKEREREDLAEAVARGNINIEAIESEYRCLMHSWDSVIIAIGNRDKILTCLNTELGKLEEKFKSTMSEIEQLKKLSKKEMEKNEALTVIKDRTLRDIKSCKISKQTELEKRKVVETDIEEMQSVIEQTEKDMEKILQENRAKAEVLTILGREFDRLNDQKSALEEEILKKLESRVTNDKAAMNLNKMVRQLKQKNREMEISLAQCENKASQAARNAETQRTANETTQKLLKDVEEKLKILEKEGDTYVEELKKCQLLIDSRQREVDLLNGRLHRVVEKSGGARSSPLQLKINSFEKIIEVFQDEIKKLQKFWLREQTNLLSLSQQRQDQIHNNNLLSKQILILEQKNLKITDELDSHRRQEEKILRNIHVLQNRLTVICDALFKKKGFKTNLDKGNELVRQESIFKLEDGELECLKLEAEIAEIEEEKVNLSKELIELNREALEWEKKFKLAKETKETMNEEKSQGGEIANMKAEIHRMEVRYSQLRKAQDKLVQDLQHCVSRRDAIVTEADAREKRVKGGMEKTRFNFQRKLDDMRNKIQQMENESDNVRQKIERLEQEQEQLSKERQQVQNEMAANKEQAEELTYQLERVRTQKQMNFELLLQLQKKLNMYTEVSKGRKPHTVYRTESVLTAEYNKQREMNGTLTKVGENLMSDFPNHEQELERLLNTLKLSVYAGFS